MAVLPPFPQPTPFKSVLLQAKRQQRRWQRGTYLIGLIMSVVMVGCTAETPRRLTTSTPTAATKLLTIWWDKGFTLEEDEALRQVVKNWEQQTGQQAKLDFFTTDELPKKAQRALQAGNPPDIMMSHGAEQTLNPRLAWEGQLADVSDVIEPIRDLYPDTILKSAYLYNRVADRKSYYAIPIHQATTQIFYWRDLVKKAGKTEKDIPEDWDRFWQFWQQVQNELRQQQPAKIYGLGLPTSAVARDTYETFEQILEAYDVQILDDQGQLRVDDPQVRQGIIRCLDWYAQLYRQGYVPPGAIKWLNPDNNRSLLNREIVMTPNNSLSIPAAVKDDPELYQRKLGTIGYPNKPNGQPMRYIVIVRQAVIFTTSKHQDQARSFLRYLLQPAVYGQYLKAAGRNLPVLKSVWNDPFWTDPKDPHRSTVALNLKNHQTRLYYYVQNPAYSLVSQDRIWGKALKRIVIENESPEQATDEAIAQIKLIFKQWPSN
uniref:Extracellular solute-binding protein family 1 n=1 Tax=Cyanothece sp. (strain PCC 7425 / ATCC 29141) TaxID=395961 RepID=B8HZC9_CYAP4